MEINWEDVLKEIKADADLGIEDLGLKDQFGQYVTLKNLRKIQINAEKLLSAVSSAQAFIALDEKAVLKCVEDYLDNPNEVHMDWRNVMVKRICAKFATKAPEDKFCGIPMNYHEVEGKLRMYGYVKLENLKAQPEVKELIESWEALADAVYSGDDDDINSALDRGRKAIKSLKEKK